MANVATKTVTFRALVNLSLRPTDELPETFSAERGVDVPAHVLTPGEVWHFTRPQTDLDRLVRARVIELLPDAPGPVNPGDADSGEEN